MGLFELPLRQTIILILAIHLDRIMCSRFTRMALNFGLEAICLLLFQHFGSSQQSLPCVSKLVSISI